MRTTPFVESVDEANKCVIWTIPREAIMRVIRSALPAVLLLLMGCGDPKPRAASNGDPQLPGADSRLLDPNGGFTLYVSNQSFAIDPVDVRVEIDGGLVVSDYFHVGNQHRFVASKLSLPQGKHRIRIWSVKGGTQLSEDFELKGEDVGVVTYWYYPESHYQPTPRKFNFGIQKGPLGID